LDEITNEKVAGFAVYEQTRFQNRGRGEDEEKCGLAVSSINSTIRVLRRMLNLAAEWGVIESAPKLALLPGENHRERVVSPEEEGKYLAVASPLLADVATILADTGMRPDECYRLCWEDLTWANGRNGSVLVRHGKTAAARRVLPMTPRVRAVLEMRWKARRGLAVACSNPQRPHRPFEP
jgi:integrase